MSKPIYELPIDDGEPWPLASAAAASAPTFGGATHSVDSPVAPVTTPGYVYDSVTDTGELPVVGSYPPPTAVPAAGSFPPPTAVPAAGAFPPPTAVPAPSWEAPAKPLTTEEALEQLHSSTPPPPSFDFPIDFSGFPPPKVAPQPEHHAVEATMPTYEHPDLPPTAPVVEHAPFAAPGAAAFAAPAPPSVFDAPQPAFDPASLPAPTTAPTPVFEAPVFEAPVFAAPASPSFFAQSVEAEPAEPAKLRLSDRVPEVGEGQEGTDPDLVAALNQVVLSRASDLHVTVNAAPMIRVDGGLKPIPDFPIWDAEKVTAALMSILTERQREEFAADLELDFAYTLSETSRFRVNFYQQREVTGAAFRLIPTQIKQLKALGVPEHVGAFAQLSRGLVLVTGPTGSGKSTTLAALIDLVNETRADHIVTVEDPIEFMHENKKSLVNQREVGQDTHSFANALKHVLRQDPDVILIGELRDLETISVALTAAETGHLVFATLHTQDAPQTIDRVIDVFPPHQQGQVRAQLAATLQGVVCQTLVKKAQGGGRAVATEVLITTPAVANLIREGKTYQIPSAMQAGRELGMHTMDQHLADLVNAGQITHQAAYDKAHDLEDLKTLISRTGDVGSKRGGAGIDFGDGFSKGA